MSDIQGELVTHAVILGLVGHGKSQLFNKITGQEVSSGTQLESLSLMVSKAQVVKSNSPAWFIFDTPGVGPRKDQWHHAMMLKKALMSTPLNAIFLLVQYEQSGRDGNVSTNIQRLLSFIPQKFHKHVVVTMSKFDECPKEQRAKTRQAFENNFLEDYCIPSSRVLFVGHEDSAENVANSMYLAAKAIPQEAIVIKESFFMANFVAKENTYQQTCDLTDSTAELKELEMNVTDFVEKFRLEQDDGVDILYAALADMQGKCTEIVEQFQQKHDAQMVEMNNFSNWLELSQETKDACDIVSRAIFAKVGGMSGLAQKKGELAIKKCPHCLEWWSKVEGCNGGTTCGNMPTIKRDESGNPFKRFVFKVISGVYTFTDKANTLGNKRGIYVSSKVAVNKGCGQSINWELMAPLGQLELEQFLGGVALSNTELAQLKIEEKGGLNNIEKSTTQVMIEGQDQIQELAPKLGKNVDNMTDEQLLELEENNGKVSKGLTRAQIDQIPQKNMDLSERC